MNDVEDEIDKLSMVISAAEKWSDVYTKSPKNHAKIIKVEAKVARIMRKYFRELAKERVYKYINWTSYHSQLIKQAAAKPKYDINIVFDDSSFMDSEESILLNVVHDPLLEGYDAGIQAGQDIYNRDIGMSSYHESVLKAARESSSQLVAQIDETTRDRIQQSIETSLNLGENIQDASSRLEDIVNDPNRAEMIARTEAVDSYTQGTLLFGQESGAETKEWEALDPEDEECDIDGEEVGLNEEFSNGEDGPPVHPNCRCGVVLNYPTGDNSDSSDGEGE